MQGRKLVGEVVVTDAHSLEKGWKERRRHDVTHRVSVLCRKQTGRLMLGGRSEPLRL